MTAARRGELLLLQSVMRAGLWHFFLVWGRGGGIAIYQIFQKFSKAADVKEAGPARVSDLGNQLWRLHGLHWHPCRDPLNEIGGQELPALDRIILPVYLTIPIPCCIYT